MVCGRAVWGRNNLFTLAEQSIHNTAAGTYFHFTCFNVEDPDDPAVGLENGQLAIPGHVLRREVFAPVVDQVLQLVDNQLRKLDRAVDALLLVGGFAGSHYLKECVEVRIGLISGPARWARPCAMG